MPFCHLRQLIPIDWFVNVVSGHHAGNGDLEVQLHARHPIPFLNSKQQLNLRLNNKQIVDVSLQNASIGTPTA